MVYNKIWEGKIALHSQPIGLPIHAYENENEQNRRSGAVEQSDL